MAGPSFSAEQHYIVLSLHKLNNIQQAQHIITEATHSLGVGGRSDWSNSWIPFDTTCEGMTGSYLSRGKRREQDMSTSGHGCDLFHGSPIHVIKESTYTKEHKTALTPQLQIPAFIIAKNFGECN